MQELLVLEGTWKGTYQLRGDASFDCDSESSARVTPMLGSRFVRIDYTWRDRKGPQEGALLIGLAETVATVVWIDSWHNGPRMLISTGASTASGGVDVRGSYPVGDGSPDWGWRTLIKPLADAWAMTMFNVSPEGEESLAVQVEFRRTS